jgi:hypothetical protein
MKWHPSSGTAGLMAALSVVAPIYASAKIYVSTEQAQKILFPGATLTQTPFVISEALQQQMTKSSSVRHPFRGDRIWRTQDGNWFIVDEVIGKHEFITYAIAIRQDGSVKGIEILEYVESYGYEVADVSWRQQFVGNRANDPLKLGKDIQNISGATLSSKHITDGVKRILTFYQAALAGNASK